MMFPPPFPGDSQEDYIKMLESMRFSEKNKIIYNFSKSRKSIYEKAIEIYKKETNIDNFYISDDAYDIYGSLVPNCYSLRYKEDRDDYSRFDSIYNVVDHKEIISNFEIDTEINLLVWKKDSDEEIIGEEKITGKLIDSNDECIKIQLDKNNELLIIKYIDISFIDDGKDI